jgi:hypothetical protein
MSFELDEVKILLGRTPQQAASASVLSSVLERRPARLAWRVFLTSSPDLAMGLRSRGDYHFVALRVLALARIRRTRAHEGAERLQRVGIRVVERIQ